MNELDRITEGDRERRLMSRLRRGDLDAAAVDAETPEFFFKLQVQTTSACNAACVTCPYPETSRELPMGRMEEEVFRTIVDQLPGRGVERVSLFLMNEPLVDPRLDHLTSVLKATVPDVSATIVTNGSRLDGARAEGLAHAGMDEVSVSVNGFDAASYEKTMSGLEFSSIVENLRDVASRAHAGRLGAMTVRVVALRLPGVEEAAERFAESVGLPVFLKPVTNRAGLVDVDMLDVGDSRAAAPTVCQRPFVKAYLLYNGDMVLCNCDWRRSFVVGNVMESTLDELWNHPRLRGQRRALAAGELPGDTPCARCDYPYRIDP